MRVGKDNAVVDISVGTLLFILYVIFVAWPFLVANQPPNEATNVWSYDYAPVHYALLYFPAYALYFYVISKNILKVKKIRKIVWPITFIVLFAATHMLFFVYSMVILRFSLITIPVGIGLLVACENIAIKLDSREDKNGKENLNLKEYQKFLNVLGCFIIPISLVLFVIFLHFEMM